MQLLLEPHLSAAQLFPTLTHPRGRESVRGAVFVFVGCCSCCAVCLLLLVAVFCITAELTPEGLQDPQSGSQPGHVILQGFHAPWRTNKTN